MTELTIKEGGNKVFRYGATFLYAFIVPIVSVMNVLAGTGSSPFIYPTRNISNLHEICITPAGFTFSIWGVIYTLLILIGIYAITLLFRTVGATKAWNLGGAVSNLFLSCLCLNFIFNISWLFAWDADNMLSSAILLLMVVLTSNAAVLIAAKSFQNSASRLYQTSRFDFWMNIFVLNAHNVYDIWVLIACLVNFMLLWDDKSEDNNQGTICIVFLSILLATMLIYFVLEQVVITSLGNPFITHYLVYLWVSIGIYQKNKDFENSTVINLIIANLSFAAIMLVLRVGFLFFRNKGNKIYKED